MRKGEKKTDQLLRPREEVLCVEIKVRTENGKRAIRSLIAVLSLIFRGRKSRCCRCSLYHMRQIEMSTADVQRRFFQDPSRETVAWQTRFFCNYNQQEEEKGKGVDRITEPQRDEDENGWKREKKRRKTPRERQDDNNNNNNKGRKGGFKKSDRRATADKRVFF